MKKRVVITGLGLVSPLGNNISDFWDNLTAGKSGVGLVSYFDTSEYTTKIAAEIKDFNPEDYFTKREKRRIPLFSQYAMVAAEKALEDANILDQPNLESAAVIVGCGIGGFNIIEEQYKTLIESGPNKVSPFTIPMIIPNMAGGQIAIKFGLKGANFCPVSACASGANAIASAFDLITENKTDIVICGGTEAAITPLSFAGFCAAKSMSKNNDNPQQACRPFDKNRDGFVMGEGAGILVLESLENALKRNAKIYAEVSGYGLSGDAYHITSPDKEGDGISKAMNYALDLSNIKSHDIDYINAHGTSTKVNDLVETKAIKRVFEGYNDLLVSSTKSMTGHLLGAAGGVEAIISALTIKNGKVPPTINLDSPDSECDLNYVPNKSLEKEINYVMSNSMGFGGHNVSLILKKFKS